MIQVSRERRRAVVLQLRHSNVRRLPADERLVLAVGMLLADDQGAVDRDVLLEATQDPDTCALAGDLLRKALA